MYGYTIKNVYVGIKPYSVFQIYERFYCGDGGVLDWKFKHFPGIWIGITKKEWSILKVLIWEFNISS